MLPGPYTSMLVSDYLVVAKLVSEPVLAWLFVGMYIGACNVLQFNGLMLMQGVYIIVPASYPYTCLLALQNVPWVPL